MLVFENKQKRFITRSIFEHLYDELKVTLWNLIDVQLNENLELDYLQVFELKIVGQKQQIIHRQEVPERERTYMISLQQAKPIKATRSEERRVGKECRARMARKQDTQTG